MLLLFFSIHMAILKSVLAWESCPPILTHYHRATYFTMNTSVLLKLVMFGTKHLCTWMLSCIDRHFFPSVVSHADGFYSTAKNSVMFLWITNRNSSLRLLLRNKLVGANFKLSFYTAKMSSPWVHCATSLGSDSSSTAATMHDVPPKCWLQYFFFGGGVGDLKLEFRLSKCIFESLLMAGRSVRSEY